ncbi:MAG: hypothetical protein ACRCUH_10840, partial [Shewanella sp.]
PTCRPAELFAWGIIVLSAHVFSMCFEQVLLAHLSSPQSFVQLSWLSARSFFAFKLVVYVLCR